MPYAGLSPYQRQKIDAEIEYRRRQRERQTTAEPQRVQPFREWLPSRFPNWRWDWSYQLPIYDTLDRAMAGELDRIAFFLHPRLGKSELVSIRFPAYLIENDPTIRVILGAYNKTFASTFSRKAKYIVGASGTKLAMDRKAADEWETVQGGGMYATGVGSGVTGRGGDWIFIDDPVKSRAEAESPAYRERVWNWYKDDLYTRTNSDRTPIMLTMTLWHEDDLGMRLLKGMDGDSWHIVRIPALAETQEERDDFARKYGLPLGQADPLGREPGQATCPDRFNVEFLKRKQRTMGTSFFALYQQRPSAPEGRMFRREWFSIVPTLPYTHRPTRFLRYWDKAGSEDAGAYTAGVLLAEVELPGEDNFGYFVLDVIMGQWEAAERENVIYQTAVADNSRYQNVTTVVEQEGGSGGKESANATIKRLRGFSAYKDIPRGDKVLRAEPVASQAAAHNIILVEGSWNIRFLDILTSFPGAIKDPVDALSGAFNWLVNKGKSGQRSYVNGAG